MSLHGPGAVQAFLFALVHLSPTSGMSNLLVVGVIFPAGVVFGLAAKVAWLRHERGRALVVQRGGCQCQLGRRLLRAGLTTTLSYVSDEPLSRLARGARSGGTGRSVLVGTRAYSPDPRTDLEICMRSPWYAMQTISRSPFAHVSSLGRRCP